MSPSQKSSQLAGVDAVKYLMAFCVVAIHFRANYIEAGHEQFLYPVWFDWLIKLAVPFFFMATGFLLQRKLEVIDSVAERRRFMFERCRKVFKMWVLWNLIYLPLVVYYFFYFDYTLLEAVKFYVYMITLYGGVFCGFPLWYLYSLIFITLTVALLQPLHGYRYWLLAIFVVAIFVRWLSPAPENPVLRLNNRLIGYAYGGGLAFVGGMLVFSFRRRLNLLFYLAAIGLSLAMKYLGDLPYIPQVGALGLFGLSLVLSGRMGDVQLIGLRRQSMWIYFTHMIVIAFYFKVFDVQARIPDEWVNFALIELGACLLGYALYRIERTPLGRPLSGLI